MTDIGTRIQAKRKAADMSQPDLAKLVGVSKVSVSQWENGSSNPRGENLLKLARALGVSPDWLVTGRSDTAPLSLPATSSSSPKLLRLIRSLESLEQSAGLPPELVDALQKTVDAFSKRSLDDDDSEGR